MSDVFDRGDSETAKGAVHLVLFGLVLICGAYNAFAWLSRRSRHLAGNALLYGAMTAYEATQVHHHWRRS